MIASEGHKDISCERRTSEIPTGRIVIVWDVQINSREPLKWRISCRLHTDCVAIMSFAWSCQLQEQQMGIS
ncbi:hypothetical protein CYMTET_51688 [Cymbomonas tetramitiformis]|uniref:Uncharacterized protein n=1 Tax=Cymbomonas tetramitiformis TaxID=36881 RepID=A0AAE0BKI4_9CHLO|nr:hypothetical protein CYMTET_51688 [Cymbomonas tetramitiformis]